MSDQRSDGAPLAGEEIHLPGPSAKPVVVAFGGTVALLGVTSSWVVVAIGIAICLLAIVPWIAETRRDIADLPVEH